MRKAITGNITSKELVVVGEIVDQYQPLIFLFITEIIRSLSPFISPDISFYYRNNKVPPTFYQSRFQGARFRVMMFHTTFNKSLAILWWSGLLVAQISNTLEQQNMTKLCPSIEAIPRIRKLFHC